jgi:hypothetical protein
MASLEIKLRRASKIYHEGEMVSGTVVVHCKGEQNHSGMTLSVDGSVNLQLSTKSVGMFEAFYNSLKPLQLLSYSVELAKPGRFPSGSTEIPFEMPLRAKQNRHLFESYHGVFVNIQYLIRVDMKRSLLSKDLQKQCEFIVEYKDRSEEAVMRPVPFTITSESVQNVREKVSVPKFEVQGHLDSTTCCITQPFTGQLKVIHSAIPIKSMELQLIRVETCGCAEGFAREATEIQNIQIADGDVCRNLLIPIYMIFPRLFTCPTLATSNFKIEFEVNVVVVFQDDHLVSENFPVKLTRF